MNNLPADVLTGILSHSPDFPSLYALKTTAKVFEIIYEHSPASIMRSVADTVLGPNLIPPALRLARWQLFMEDKPGAREWAERGRELTMSEHAPPLGYVLTWKEARLLQRCGTHASLYEAQFSRRYKNCLSGESLLTTAESTRFRAAFFRLWLFLLFQRKGEGTDDENPSEGFLTDDEGDVEDVEEEEEDGEDVQQFTDPPEQEGAPLAQSLLTLNCDDALSHLGQPDIQDAFLVQTFLDAFVLDVGKRNQWEGRIISISPPDWLYSQYLFEHFVNWSYHYKSPIPYLTGRLGSTPSVQKLHEEFISDICAKNDTCRHCSLVKGLELRNLDNLNDIACKIGVSDIWDNLPGLLRSNSTELETFSFYMNNKSPLYIETVLHEMFDLRLPRLDGKWERDDRICLDCWRELLELGGRDWWYETKKRLPNFVVLEDCWYGQECRTQTHKRSHAQRLNHLCDLTKRISA